MGADIRKELVSVLKDPENEKKMKKLFKHVDADKSGALDRKEFDLFARILFKLDMKEAHDDFKEEYKSSTGFSFGSGIAFNLAIKKAITERDIDNFIERMFKEADKDSSGTIEFDEFVKFIKDHLEDDKLEAMSGLAEKNWEAALEKYENK